MSLGCCRGLVLLVRIKRQRQRDEAELMKLAGSTVKDANYPLISLSNYKLCLAS